MLLHYSFSHAPSHVFGLRFLFHLTPSGVSRPGVMVVPTCHSPGGRKLRHPALHLSPQRRFCLENTDSTESLRLSITVWRQRATAWIGRGGQRGQRFLGSSVQTQTPMGNMVMAAYRGRHQGQWLNKLLNLFRHWCLKASTFPSSDPEFCSIVTLKELKRELQTHFLHVHHRKRWNPFVMDGHLFAQGEF